MDAATTPITGVQRPEKVVTPDAVAPQDRYIWGVYIFLLLVSVVELFSASSREIVTTSMFGLFTPIIRHVSLLLGGLALAWWMSRRHWSRFVPLIKYFAILSAALMAYVIFAGEIVNGARRSINIGISIQPSEMIKLAVPLVLAVILSRTQGRRNKDLRGAGIWFSVTVVALYCLLLVTQGMTNTLLLMSISLSMILIGGANLVTIIKVLGIYLVLAAVFGIGALMLMPSDTDPAKRQQLTEKIEQLKANGELSPWQVTVLDKFGDRGRVATWILRLSRHNNGNPWEEEITSENAQEIYAYMAQARGGLIGVGPGNSRETSRLPLAFSDYIYSIITEEFGIAGAALVLLAYILLLGRAFAVSSTCAHTLPALLIIGLAITVVMQALFHIAIVTGVFPVSGQPLPLISKGGCSILMVSIAFGMMLSISRFAVRTSDKKNIKRQEAQILPDEMQGENLSKI